MKDKQDLTKDLQNLSKLTFKILLGEIKWGLFWLTLSAVCIFEAFWFGSLLWAIPITIFLISSAHSFWKSRVFILTFLAVSKIRKRVNNQRKNKLNN